MTAPRECIRIASGFISSCGPEHAGVGAAGADPDVDAALAARTDTDVGGARGILVDAAIDTAALELHADPFAAASIGPLRRSAFTTGSVRNAIVQSQPLNIQDVRRVIGHHLYRSASIAPKINLLPAHFAS